MTSFFSCVFEKCEFLNCNFNNTDILNCKFIDCTFVNCDFTEATLQDVLVEGGFKSNNIFNKLNIKDNVVGIDVDESNLISDCNQTTTVNETKKTKSSQIEETVVYPTADEDLSQEQKLNKILLILERIETKLDRLK